VMEAVESITKLVKYKKPLMMHIPSLLSLLNGAMMVLPSPLLVKMELSKSGPEMAVSEPLLFLTAANQFTQWHGALKATQFFTVLISSSH